jgi:light-regulated signal transduction histidine kinase (bacteriophytochrome)
MLAKHRVALKRGALYRYGLACLITLAFLLFSRTIFFLISYNPIVFILTSVITCAWLFGRGPGVASAFIAAFAARPIFFPSAPWRFDFGDVSRLIFYLLLTAFISYLVGARRKAEAELIAANEQLEQRVAERTAELSLANEELRKSNEALRRANADLEQFAYSASHDLQEPLRNVAVYTQLLELRYSKAFDNQGLQFLNVVTSGARRMEMLIRDLLAYTHATRGEDGEIVEVDARATLESVLLDLATVVKEAGAEVSGQNLPRLRMREVHLKQLLQNLVSNAIKYRGDNSPRVNVSAAQLADVWQFAVEDNGIGIAPEYKERIFGVFKRLHANGNYSGTGIGLAICKRLVERYDGRIWVESQPGEGATFYFTIREPDRTPS